METEGSKAMVVWKAQPCPAESVEVLTSSVSPAPQPRLTAASHTVRRISPALREVNLYFPSLSIDASGTFQTRAPSRRCPMWMRSALRCSVPSSTRFHSEDRLTKRALYGSCQVCPS